MSRDQDCKETPDHETLFILEDSLLITFRV